MGKTTNLKLNRTTSYFQTNQNFYYKNSSEKKLLICFDYESLTSFIFTFINVTGK